MKQGELEYGFRIDPMSWIQESQTVPAAQVRTFLLGTPLPGDEAILKAEIDAIMATQKENGCLGNDPEGNIIRLERLGCSPDRKDVQRAVAYVCEDYGLAEDNTLGTYALHVATWGNWPDKDLIARSTEKVAQEVATMHFWSMCPWGGQVQTHGMWAGREYADIQPALDRALGVMLDAVQDKGGWPVYLDPIGFLDAIGSFDDPVAKEILIKQIPMILRTQQTDGTWGGMKHLGYGPEDSTYLVLRALIKWDLLEALRDLPPFPADWDIVRSIPLPSTGDVSRLVWTGSKFLYYDEESGCAVGISPLTGEEISRIKLPDNIHEMRRTKDGRVGVNVCVVVNDDLEERSRWAFVPDGKGTLITEPNVEFVSICNDWSIHDFFGGPKILQKRPEDPIADDLDNGEAPFGNDTTGVAWDGDSLWVLDNKDKRICQIRKVGEEAPAVAPPVALIENAVPYLDDSIPERGTLERRGAFRQCLMTAIKIMEGEVDPAWVQGSSAFAFRIVAHESLCSSAVDWWDWDVISGKAFPQLGYNRVFLERDNMENSSVELHRQIVRAVNKGVPVIAFNAHAFDWSLIVGYDDNKQEYMTIKSGVELETIAYDKIGRHVLDRLTLIIPEKMTPRFRERVVRQSLITAVEHANSMEECGAPTYISGLNAYEQWADALDRGPESNKDYGDLSHQPAIFFTARCYAADYLKKIKGDDPDLDKAQKAYERVAEHLGNVWALFPAAQPEAPADAAVFAQAAEEIRAAGKAETEAIEHIKVYLNKPPKPVSPEERVRREGDKVWIEGVGTLMTPHAMNSFVQALSVMGESLGDDCSFDFLMGASGAAFRLMFHQPEWCPSSPDPTCGYNHSEALMKATGYKLNCIQVSDENRDNARQQLVDSVDKGYPVVGIDLKVCPEWGLVVGYEDAGRKLWCRTIFDWDNRDEYGVAEGWPWIFYTVEGREDGVSRRDMVVESLRIAVMLAETKAFDDYASGFAAFEVWSSDLQDDARFDDVDEKKLQDLCHANRWSYISLKDSRKVAVKYLRSVAGQFDEEEAGHLLRAADVYAQIVNMLETGMSLSVSKEDLEKNKNAWTRAMRFKQAVLLREVLGLEREAIAELKQAMAVIDQ